METVKTEKIKRFLADKVMSDAVYEIVLGSFMKTNKTDDVHRLASSMLAIEKLGEAWKELQRFKIDTETTRQSSGQVGL